MKSLKFIILIFSFAAISAAVSGCSLKFWQKPINPPVTKNEGDATATSTEEIDMSDWLTYRNEEYGFEVKYPSGVDPKVYEHPYRPSITFKKDDIQLYFEVAISKPYAQEEANYYKDINNYNFLDLPQIGKGILGGQEAVFFEAPNGYCDGPGCGYPFVAYSTQKNNNYYNLVFYYDTKLNPTEELILFSFKFLN